MIEFLNILPGCFVIFPDHGSESVGRVMMIMQGARCDKYVVSDSAGKISIVNREACRLHRVPTSDMVFDRYGNEVPQNEVYTI